MKSKLLISYLLMNFKIIFATNSYIDSIENTDLKYLVQQVVKNPSFEDHYDTMTAYWKQSPNGLKPLPIESLYSPGWSPLYILHGLYNLQVSTTIESDKQTFNLFHRASQDDLNEAQYQLARMYSKGIGTEQDIKKGFELNVKAALNGNIKAKEDFAHGYVEAQTNNYKHTFENLYIVCQSRRELLNKSYHKYQLAVYYFRGWGTSPDWQKAHTWLDQIETDDLEFTNIIEMERERFPRGYIGYVKRKIPKDYKITETFSDWMEYQDILAIKFNNSLSQYLIAMTYSRSHKSTQQEIDKAINYYRMADNNNFAPATFSLGILLSKKEKVSDANFIMKKYLMKALKNSLDNDERKLINEKLCYLNKQISGMMTKKYKSDKQNREEVEFILKQDFSNDFPKKKYKEKNKRKRIKNQILNLKSNKSDPKDLTEHRMTSSHDQFIDSNEFKESSVGFINENNILVPTNLDMEHLQINNFTNDNEEVSVQHVSKKNEFIKELRDNSNSLEKNSQPLNYDIELEKPHSLEICISASKQSDSNLVTSKLLLKEETEENSEGLNSMISKSTDEEIYKQFTITELQSNKLNFNQHFNYLKRVTNDIKESLHQNEINKQEILEQIELLEKTINYINVRSVAALQNEYQLRQENFNLLKRFYPKHK